LFILLAGSYLLVLVYLSDRDWEEAVAEADRLDPGWRLEELEARRAVLPDEQNAALQVLAAAGLLPKPWPPEQTTPSASSEALEASLRALAPTTFFDPDQAQVLTAALEAAKPALAEARKLKDLPRGRYPRVSDGQRGPAVRPAAVGVSRLLSYDVLRRGLALDADGALESCRALLNVSRSFGDDSLVALFRLSLRPLGYRSLEWALAQGQPSEAALAAVQKLLADDEADLLFLLGARGFRADMDQLFEGARAGDPAYLPGNPFERLGAPVLVRNLRPVTLRLATELVEIAKLPVEEQEREFKRRGFPKMNDTSFLARTYVLPKVQKVTRDLSWGQLRTQTELRCAVAAVAAERYRRARGSWPDSPAALVPDYLRAVPLDPFDGQPLRYRKVGDGIVVYSIGPDRKDDGGKLDYKTPGAPGTDLGFRLWHPEKRPPPAPPRQRTAH
jgi:hypothetical protein